MSTSVKQLSCQELVELVTSYLEGALSPGEHASFVQHIEGCTGCREYLAQMQATIELTGTLTPADLSPAAEAKLLETFRDWRSG